ncbi:hypothetical protein K435DRAFT_813779 [Dendrothele bispora CBS 962.96]|uniref:Uncharacterized protein n=1 Tax=Dendrothele bispora (strain CBS 962.96) TaxID=1314807 RepID=A0A4S8KKN8_DENBC|nr:hypothetical protein K435DRAFT_813779 [Dendrothele bispora CBS 962.96]
MSDYVADNSENRNTRMKWGKERAGWEDERRNGLDGNITAEGFICKRKEDSDDYFTQNLPNRVSHRPLDDDLNFTQKGIQVLTLKTDFSTLTIMSTSSQSSNTETNDSSDDDSSNLIPEGWFGATFSDPHSTRWDWVGDPNAQVPWETFQNYHRPVDIPTELAEAKKWLRQCLGHCNGDSWSSEYLVADYVDALKDVVLIRPDFTSEQLVSRGLSNPLADWETHDWCRLQGEEFILSRVFDAKLPLPSFTGAELRHRREAFFRKARCLFDRLEDTERTIMELARARQELNPNHSVAALLFCLRICKDYERVALQVEAEQTLAVVRALYLLSAVTILYAA